MRLVDDDGKTIATMPVADLIENNWEFLHRGNDNFLTTFNEASQIARAFGVAYGGAYLGELFDRILDLFVENTPVSNHNNGIKNSLTVFFRTDELVGQPGNRIRFARTGRMLNEVALACAVFFYIVQQLMHHLELVIARNNLPALFLAGFGIFFLHDLGIVFQNIGEAGRCEQAFPEVVGFETVRIRRVAGAVIPALIERQEPGGRAVEFGTHAHFGIIDREMEHAAAEMEQWFPRIAVAAVKLERGHRQAVDEQPQVERAPRLVSAVAQLAGNAETVQCVQNGSRFVSRAGCAIE